MVDIFAHYLWTYAIFFKQKKVWLLGIIGILPDLLSFGPHFVLSLATRGFKFGRPSNIPSYVQDLYNLTHSLVIFLIVFGAFYYFLNKYMVYLLPWAIHILIDIPTHSRLFFPTPFLWPISNFTVDGIAWGQPWFLILNYSLLVIFFVWRFLHK